MSSIIEVRNLAKIYSPKKNPVQALKGISFEVEKGEIFGLLGVNGAGKSTTLNILNGLLTATSGEVKIFGKDFITHEEEIKNRMNVATAYADLAGNLTVYRNLKIFAIIYNVKEYETRIHELMVQFGITDLAQHRFEYLSAGQKTRVNLCKSLLNNPEILLLDEPTASLDPAIAERVRKMILKLQDDQLQTVLFTSHNILEVEQMCDRVALLHRGQIYMIDTPENLARKHNAPGLEEVFIKLAEGELDE